MSGKDQVTLSHSFTKGSNCSVFSNFIPLFPRFLLPSGHDNVSVPIGRLFPILGRSLNGTFLATPVYLTYTEVHLYYAVWVWPILISSHSKTPHQHLKTVAPSIGLGYMVGAA